MIAKPTYFIGLMSGTSMDAIDAALVAFTGDSTELIATKSSPIDQTLYQQLQALCAGTNNELALYASLDSKMGEHFADTVLALLDDTQIKACDISAIGSHGQTVRHYPHNTPPNSLQIGDPNIIAERTGITTVSDFRRADLAAGGEGAPLVPAFHQAVFKPAEQARAIVNIGGIANITLPSSHSNTALSGFDTGPGNILMDIWALQHLNKRYDEDGRWAASGTVIPLLLDRAMADPYIARLPPKSTGREHYNQHWLDSLLQHEGKNYAASDIQATLCEFTAHTIMKAIDDTNGHIKELLVCGGGALNTHLMDRLDAIRPAIKIKSTLDAGIHPCWVEAMAFAWLAKQRLALKPGNIPSATGARDTAILGGIYQP